MKVNKYAAKGRYPDNPRTAYMLMPVPFKAMFLKVFQKCWFQIDITRTLESQGPFVAIIHKMTDRMIEAMDGNENAEKNMADVEVSRPYLWVDTQLLTIFC